MKHWAFDLDGTLVDSFSHFFVALDVVFKEHGTTFPKELQHTALTLPLHEMFAKHLGSSAVVPAMKRLQDISNDDAAKIQPFEGAMELITGLKERGSKVAIWTNRDLTSASLILQHTGIAKLVEVCVSGHCVTERKPHHEGLFKIAKHFACSPDEITMVGDHETDMIAAKAGGARAVRASWHTYWPQEKCTRADYQFHELSAFSLWIQKQ